jgi:hypothetical protein
MGMVMQEVRKSLFPLIVFSKILIAEKALESLWLPRVAIQT